MAIRSNNNCPLPHDVPGYAVIDTTSKHLSFRGYPVVIERDNATERSRSQRVIFNDYRDGVLYASLV